VHWEKSFFPFGRENWYANMTNNLVLKYPICCITSQMYIFTQFYVYWTVHHLDSWIKIDQLDVTCFIISLFTAQHVSNVSTSIFRSLQHIVDLFHMLYCSGSMCVGVTVWYGCIGVVSLRRLKHCFSLHKDTTPPQPKHTVTPTHIEPEQHNTWNKSTICRKLLKMDVLTFETCWAVNSEIIKQVISSWSVFIQLYSVVCHIPKGACKHFSGDYFRL